MVDLFNVLGLKMWIGNHGFILICLGMLRFVSLVIGRGPRNAQKNQSKNLQQAFFFIICSLAMRTGHKLQQKVGALIISINQSLKWKHTSLGLHFANVQPEGVVG